jgi:SSS family solute:Na+ symporter
MLQTFVLLAGTGAVTYFGLNQLGGWDGMMETLQVASTTPGNPSPDQFFNLWRPHDDTAYPWTGMLFGAPILGVWYWCTDQFIVQRTLSAKDISNARKGTLFAGFLKLLPVFIFFIPGVIAFALSQKGMLNFSLDNPDHALPAMINGFLPLGLKGLAISGLLAALMSSLSSAFNSSSTLITFDFYKQYKPEATDPDGRRAFSLPAERTGLYLAPDRSCLPLWAFLQGNQCPGRHCGPLVGFCSGHAKAGH